MKRIATVLGVIIAGALGAMLVTGWALASRNSSGTYVPYASPFVPNTSISSATMNGWFGDVGSELSDSLSRSGRGGMTAPLRTVDGTLAAPSHAFTSETGSGWWRQGSGDVALSVLGQNIMHATTSGAAVTGTFAVSGAVTVPTGLSTDPTITPTNGDIFAARGTTSGYVFLGRNSGGRYIGYDGANYLMPGAPLVASGPSLFVVAGRFIGNSATCGQGGAPQTGSVSVTCSRVGAGSYTLTVPGLTSSAIVFVSINSGVGSPYYITAHTIATGSFKVAIADNATTPIDIDFSFMVAKL